MKTTMTTRALTRLDAEDILDLYRGLSGRSRALRFGVPTPSLSAWTMCELVTLDGHMRSAVGVFDDAGALVAEGRWVRLHNHPEQAEAAFTVADRHQRNGLGAHLMDAVVETAAESGIETLHFSVSAENRGMAALLRRHGVTLTWSGGSGEAVLELAPQLAGVGTAEDVRWRTA